MAIRNAANNVFGPANVLVTSWYDLVSDCAAAPGALLICIDGQRINPLPLIRAREYVASLVLWTFDDPYNLRSHKEVAALFDLVFTNDSSSVDAYDGKGHFLPLAAPSDAFERYAAETFQYDVFFCGTAWPNRVVTLNRLLRDRPNLKYNIALTYNQYVPAVPLTTLQASTYIRSLAFPDFMLSAARSKITLGLHRVFEGSDAQQESSSPGPRVFEVGATKSLQMCETSGPDFEQIFDRSTISYFNDYDQMLANIDTMLASEGKRSGIAGKCRTLVREKHTYEQRLHTIKDKVAGLKPRMQTVRDTARRPKLLYVVHNTVGGENVGGLEIHQDILSKNLRADFDILFFTTVDKGEKLGRQVQLLDASYKLIEEAPVPTRLIHGLVEAKDIERFFSLILVKYGIDLVHFFHVMNNVPSLAHAAHAVNVPYVMSVHDFYLVCRSFNLLDFADRYCDTDITNIKDCDICLATKYKFPAGSQQKRRDYIGPVLAKSEKLIYMSKSTRDIVERNYPTAAMHKGARIHGAPIPNSVWSAFRAMHGTVGKSAAGPARFVALGNFQDHKGANYFLAALRATRNLQAEFHFHGSMPKPLMEKLTTALGSRAIIHGPYKPGALDLSQYQFSLHLSTWPETYCQTLSEAWAARLVPIVTDLGALGERVTSGVNGYKVDPRRPGGLASLLEAICQDPIRYLAVQDQISDQLFLKQPEHAQMYREAYQQALVGRTPARPLDVSGGVAGISMSALGRAARSASWNGDPVAYHGDGGFYPVLKAQTESDLKRFKGKIHDHAMGSIDEVGGKAPKDHLPLVKNDERIAIKGWCPLPSDGQRADENARPVALIQGKGKDEFYTHGLAAVPRPDVADVFGEPKAVAWGIEGEFCLMTADEMITGPVSVWLAWLDAKGHAWRSQEKAAVEGFFGAGARQRAATPPPAAAKSVVAPKPASPVSVAPKPAPAGHAPGQPAANPPAAAAPNGEHKGQAQNSGDVVAPAEPSEQAYLARIGRSLRKRLGTDRG